MFRNAGPTPKVYPALTGVVLTPDAIPRLFAGTVFIMDDLFGEANTPIPLPASIGGVSSPQT